jgi:anoctamin-1
MDRYRIELKGFYVCLQISVAVGAVFGVVLYRMASIGPESLFQGQNKFMLIPATAAVINLVCIMLLNYVSLLIICSWVI